MTSEESSKIMDTLQAAADHEMWGEITVIFKRGRPIMIRTNETKPINGEAHERKNPSG